MFKVGDRVYSRRHRRIVTVSIVGSRSEMEGWYFCYHYLGESKVCGWIIENGLSLIPPK